MNSQSVLPMILGNEKDEIIEEIICVSISGGADYVEGMPRRLSLMRIRDGVTIKWAEYEFKEMVESPVSEQESST